MNVNPAALPGTLAALVLLTGALSAEPKPEPTPAPAQPDHVSFDFTVNNQVRRVVIELNPGAAPQTVANFKKLIQDDFYNGLAVHRAIPHYLVQLGDPLTKDDSARSTWGTGSPGYTVPAEIKLKHQRGCVAMARLPDSRNPSRASNGSQFYIALADMSQLDGQYTVFGQVVRGIEHLDYISEQTTDTNDTPVDRIKVAAVVGEGPSKTPPMEALAQGAGSLTKNAVKGAESLTKGAVDATSQGVRAAGSFVKDADKVIPKFDLPKVPFIGRGRHEAEDSENTAEAPTAPAPSAPAPAPTRHAAAAAPAPASAPMPAPAPAPAPLRTPPPAPAPKPNVSSSQEVILEEVPEGEEAKEKRGLRLPSLPKFHKPGGSAMSDPVPSSDLIPTSSASASAPAAPKPATKPPVSDSAAATEAPANPPASGERQRVVIPVESPKPKEKGVIGRVLNRFW
jgi:cyclophilin family peptidyl-prolyl cis-trans isomerase